MRCSLGARAVAVTWVLYPVCMHSHSGQQRCWSRHVTFFGPGNEHDACSGPVRELSLGA